MNGFGFETKDYLVRLMDNGSEKELREVQKLRYKYLLQEFDEKKNDEDGLDDDGFDEYSESILVIEKKSGKIVGTYRVATEKTLKGKRFKSEEEFDISALRSDPGGVVEAGRAVVHGDFRNGIVIGLLWKALITYATDRGLRYVIGTCSLHGTDPSPYAKCTSYLNQHFICEKFDVRAVRDAFEYGTEKDVSSDEAQVPGLLKAYLSLGARVSGNGFIDYDFNCCDVMIVLDLQNTDERMLRFVMR